jgi:hypothetical protein
MDPNHQYISLAQRVLKAAHKGEKLLGPTGEWCFFFSRCIKVMTLLERGHKDAQRCLLTANEKASRKIVSQPTRECLSLSHYF